jgi:rSAM/selenodomain-associated transferase 2
MSFHVKNPELSIIVPVLNEAGLIQELLGCLSAQQGVEMEVIVCDGGSTDATLERASVAAKDCPFPVRIVRSHKGRGRQLNAGTSNSRGKRVLFLHADSLFADRLALRKGLDALGSAVQVAGHERVAGRFALDFKGEEESSIRFLYYNECKARLNLRECIHGDQGFLLSRSFLAEAGSFTETLPVCEDTRFAERVRRLGEWILLPVGIITSARRFETEGFAGRQMLNALTMTLAAIGREDFLLEMPHIYSSQDNTKRLRLLPFLDRIGEMTRTLPLRQKPAFWYSVGSYLLENTWQLAFALDVIRNFRRKLPAGRGGTPCLKKFERYVKPLLDHPPGRVVTAALVWISFRLLSIFSAKSEGGS